MLPPNFLTIPQIQHERHAGSKLFHLTTLLEFLLKLYNPNVTAAEEGRDPKVGERIIACQEAFNNFTRVLWALKVRNSFAHVTENEFSERDHRNAVDCLIEAIGDVCRQPAIPYEIKQAIYHDPDADQRSSQEVEDRLRREQQAQVEREKRAQDVQAQRLRAEAAKIEEARRHQDRREKELQERSKRRQSIISGFRRLFLLALLVVVGFALWPKMLTLYKGDKASASVVRTEAELALKRVKDKRKQKEYGGSINRIEAAWRDGEIEFRRGNYKLAEEKYRQLIGLWDGLNAQIAESLSFEDLQSEVNALRQAAKAAQAPQKAADAWNQAEDLRRNAVTARKNGSLQEAKGLIIQARQHYEIAQAAAMSQSVDAAENIEASLDDKSDTETPATPTAQPAPIRTSSPPVVRPTVGKEQETSPSDKESDIVVEDDTFTISEKEFMYYVTKRVNPIVSPQAGNAGASGPVVVVVYLSNQGHLSKSWAIEGDPLLREAALAALRQWSFRPYLRDRVPTGVKSKITIYVR